MEISFIGPCPDCGREITATVDSPLPEVVKTLTIRQGEKVPGSYRVLSCETQHPCVSVGSGDFLYANIEKGKFTSFFIPV